MIRGGGHYYYYLHTLIIYHRQPGLLRANDKDKETQQAVVVCAEDNANEGGGGEDMCTGSVHYRHHGTLPRKHSHTHTLDPFSFVHNVIGPRGDIDVIKDIDRVQIQI